MKLLGAAVAAVTLAWAGGASAASIIDFEDYALGTIIAPSFDPQVGKPLPFVNVWGTVVLNPLTGVGHVLQIQTAFTGKFYYNYIDYSATRLAGTNIVYIPFVHSFDAYTPEGGTYRRNSGFEMALDAGVWTTIAQNEAVHGWAQGRRIISKTAYIDNIVFDERFAVVPEPTTWAMLISGFGLVGAALRRRPRLQAA